MPFRLRLSFRWRPDLSDPILIRMSVGVLTLSSGVGVLVLTLLADRVGLPLAILLALLATFAAIPVFGGVILAMADAAARGFTWFLFPSARTNRAPQDFSEEKALVARGRVDAALALLEARLFAAPDDAEAAVFAADLHAREARQPLQAESLFRRARESRRATAAHDLYATQRLIDLYLGPLDDEPRAADELRRLVERHPRTRAAEHAATVLRRLSATESARPATP